MNKIKIVNDQINSISIDDSILYSINENIFGVKIIKFNIIKDTSLSINYDFTELTKLEFIFELEKGVNLDLNEIKNGESSKIRTTYILNNNSNLNMLKFNDVNTISESIIVNLNGKNSKINYIFKTISKDKEKYELIINHNNSNTESFIKNNGVAIKNGKIKFIVSSFVPAQKKECNVNQVNRIINLTKNKCEIKPNLYIDEYDVSANHSALIGNFSEEEMFYLQSRGIEKNEALMLLIKGFMISDINTTLEEEINKKIEKYWR